MDARPYLGDPYGTQLPWARTVIMQEHHGSVPRCSHPLQVVQRSLVHDVSRIQR